MKNFLHTESYGGLRISIASPERIRSWSRGEVTKPETINYRSFKPENDGLFCCRIFGPAKDYECLCGKYKGIKFRGVTCERCGVEITQSRVRRSYMGHIDLAAPVLHIWFLRSLPCRVGLLLDMTVSNLERVLYFDSFVVVDPGLTPLKKGQLLSEQERLSVYDEYGEDAVSIMIGAEAIQAMLMSLDLHEIMKTLRATLKMSDKKTQQQRLARRLKTVQAFISSGNRPEWMVMTVLPVLPCDLRPLVQLEGGRFATSDLNDLYRRVINRNNRLRRLKELEAPEIILRNEKRMLQESVDCLFDNSRRRRFSVSHNKRPLKSLSDMLKGKQGRFRQNLLGKRVDYSGRSVIVVGPTLKLHQCGLPKQIALELYKPFVYSKLVSRGIVGTLKGAKYYVDNEAEHKEVWDNLAEVMREHPVILNRAPTLYRLGIQAFEPLLVEGKAIHLHPLVCAAFNADFDGDQMAVHLPLSLEARMEARVLMMSTNNILHPANGEPIIVPTQDIVLGIYYLTMDAVTNKKISPLSSDKKQGKESKNIMTSLAEVEHALFAKKLSLHDPIIMLMEEQNDKGEIHSNIVETTPGRAIVSELLPKHTNLPYALVNRLLTKSDISDIIGKVYKYCGEKKTVIFCDRLMNLGFRYACSSGISFSRQDMVIPQKKASLVQSSQESVSNFDSQYREGLITRRERDNKVIDSWLRCADKVANAMMEEISKPSKEGINSIYMMSHSGARGSVAQMKQLGGMRGLMAKPSGEIIPTPIVSNFREGLSVFEYFNSTHGARKGQVDTALKTANSGYLTRRLVDVAQDYTIIEKDCGTKDGLTLRPAVSAGEVIIPLGKRAFGRVLCEDVKDPSQVIILSEGDMIDTSASEHIDESHIHELKVRSPIFCKSRGGVCSRCYGQDIARNREANIGEAVGIIGAQSIGEPGTQMTMRTFHHGGAAELEQQSSLEAPSSGKIYFIAVKVFNNSQKHHIVASHNAEIMVRDDKDHLIFMHKIPYGARLFVKNGQSIDGGQMLAKWEPHYRPILAGIAGAVVAEDLKSEISFRKTSEASLGGVVLDWRSSANADLKPALVVQSQESIRKKQHIEKESAHLVRHMMIPGAQVHVWEGQKVLEGDLLASFPVVGAKTMDITGGVPRVVELFENRTPKERAFLSPIRGRVEYADDFRGKRRIIVKSLEKDRQDQEYLFSKEQQLTVQNGDIVEKGGYLVNGSPTLQDMLIVMGEEATALYLIEEIQNVYRAQGVSINDRHIEVIVRRMLCRIKVTFVGDSDYIEQEEVNREEFLDTQERLRKQNKKPPTGTLQILGITRAALQTSSFVSAASFQETVRVLTEAAIQGRVDKLSGLKENVIVGRLIPAGTGRIMRDYQAKIERERLENLETAAIEQETPTRSNAKQPQETQQPDVL